MAQERKKGGRKGYKFGGKQQHGHSRAAYFALARARIAANKEKRIKKEALRQKKCKEKKEQDEARRVARLVS